MSRTLTRRKSLLALLEEACRAAAPARVRATDRHRPAWDTTLLLLECDGVLLRGEGPRARDHAESHGKAEIRFDYAGERYAFLARPRGRVGRRLDGEGLVEAVKFGLPLRLTPLLRRESMRFALTGLPTIVARLTNVLDKAHRFQACLTDASDGGLGMIAPADQSSAAALNSLWYAEFETLDEPRGFEFIVRLAHCVPQPGTLKRSLGWAFAACDDASHFEAQLDRLKRSLLRTGAREQGTPRGGGLGAGYDRGGNPDDDT